MIKVDLGRKATFDTMSALDLYPEDEAVRLRRLRDASGDLERPGREPTSSPQKLSGRDGYQANFLEDWSIDLPLLTGDRADDMVPLSDGSGVELKYRHFSCVMSRSRRLPLITACNIDGSKSRKLPRISTWSFDGRIPRECQVGDELYFQNELDRGHMVRREDPVWGSLAEAKQANEDTFHFTNSCPQMAGVNQVTWLGLEDYILNHTRSDSMRVSVFTGPYFSEDDIEYRSLLIPMAFWKVVAIVTEDGRPSATAYKVSQDEELGQLEHVFGKYKTFQISVASVMEDTGLDFSKLVPYDGISEHERAGGAAQRQQISDLTDIRI
jgi:endonuclease G